MTTATPELEDIAFYQQNGAVCLRNVFSPYWLERVSEGIARNLAAPSKYAESLTAAGASARFFNDYCNWQQIPEFREFVYDSPAAEIVARLMGSQQAIFYHEHVLVKEPGNQRKTPWHHDQPYYPVNGRQMCSIWMPLDPVPQASSLRFVKGSHDWGRWFVPRKFATAKNYEFITSESRGSGEEIEFESVPEIEEAPQKYEILVWALEPGDCVVFNGLTLHGAAGNVSRKHSRRVLSTRWFGEEARFAPRPWEISPPITGGLEAGESMACETFPIVWSRPE